MKKIFAIGLLLITFLMAIAIDAGFNGMITFWNAPSLLFVVLIDIAVLILSDNVSDFLRGISVARGNTEFTLKEMKSSYVAYSLLIKVTFISSILGTMVGLTNMAPFINFTNEDDISYFFVATGVAILTIIYGLIINMFLLALRARINKEMIYRE